MDVFYCCYCELFCWDCCVLPDVACPPSLFIPFEPFYSELSRLKRCVFNTCCICWCWLRVLLCEGVDIF